MEITKINEQLIEVTAEQFCLQNFLKKKDFINLVRLWLNYCVDFFNAHDYKLKMTFNNSNLILRVMRLSEKVAVCVYQKAVIRSDNKRKLCQN